MLAIELKKITKEYKNKKYNYNIRILNNINLKAKNGEFIIITGHSGSGKSTLLQIIGLLDTPSSGDIFIYGSNYTKASESLRTKIRKKLIGFVYQFHYLLHEFTTIENLILPQLIYGTSINIAKQKAQTLLKEFGLWNKKDYLTSILSGGEQQRIAILRAIINTPKIILADEPTGNLDKKNSEFILKLLLTQVKKKALVIFITHNIDFIKFADKAFILKKQKLKLFKTKNL